MDLDERLLDLCDQGKRAQAQELAKAALKNEPVEAVVIADPHAQVDTPRFRGVHQLTTDYEDEIEVCPQGKYTYKSDAVELSFSTVTMNEQISGRVEEALTEQSDTDPQAANDDQSIPGNSASSDPAATATALDRPTTSPVDFLKGLR